MSDPSKLVTRVEELESRLAFQDDLIERLNEVVARQDKEIVLLTKRLQELMERLNDLDSATAGGTPESHEVPPHY